MEKICNAESSDIIITDDKKYAVGLLYDSYINEAPIISLKNSENDLTEILDSSLWLNKIEIFYIHWLAEYLYKNYKINNQLLEQDYNVIAKLYAVIPKFQTQKGK